MPNNPWVYKDLHPDMSLLLAFLGNSQLTIHVLFRMARQDLIDPAARHHVAAEEKSDRVRLWH